MDMSAATARITRELHEVEGAFDETLLRLSGLMTTLIKARLATDVAPVTGQAAIMKLVRTQQSLLESQNELNRTHRELRKTAVEVRAMPDENYCPPSARAPAAVDVDQSNAA